MTKTPSKPLSTEEYRLQQATEQVSDYYNKKRQFSGAIDENCQRHLRQKRLICDAYRVTKDDLVRFLGDSLSPGFAAQFLLEN